MNATTQAIAAPVKLLAHDLDLTVPRVDTGVELTPEQVHFVEHQLWLQAQQELMLLALLRSGSTGAGRQYGARKRARASRPVRSNRHRQHRQLDPFGKLARRNQKLAPGGEWL